MPAFIATLRQVGINPCVQVPARISQAFGRRGYVPVHVHLDRGVVPSTLVPLGHGTHRLYINAAMLRLTDARVGQRISLRLELDTSDRTLATPAPIAALLDEAPLARRHWDALSPSRRKEIIRYFSFAKTDATRQRTLAKLRAILTSPAGHGALSGIQIGPRKRPA